MRILALDLGKFKSVACVFDTVTAQHVFVTIPTRAADVHDLFAEHEPQRVVIEIGAAAGFEKNGVTLGACPWERRRPAGIFAQVHHVPHECNSRLECITLPSFSSNGAGFEITQQMPAGRRRSQGQPPTSPRRVARESRVMIPNHRHRRATPASYQLKLILRIDLR